MRFFAIGLGLASTAALASAASDSFSLPLSQNQTAKPFACKRAEKTFLNCLLANQWNATVNTWIDSATCLNNYKTAAAQCRAPSAIYQDGEPTDFDASTPGHASYAAVGSVDKAGYLKAQVLVPSCVIPEAGITRRELRLGDKLGNSNKGGLSHANTYTISCKTCTKLVSKVLKCVLPLAVPTGADAFDTFFNKTESCLTTCEDRVNWQLCEPTPADILDGLTPVNGQVTYVVANSDLTIDDNSNACPSVEASVTGNGKDSVKVHKIQYAHLSG